MADAAPARPDHDAEIARLNKIIQALMDRAERSTDIQGSDFTLFQTTIMLEEQVRARTAALEAVLAEKEAISAALAKSEAKFAAIFSMTPDPIAMTRLRDGVIVEASDSFSRYFGIKEREPIGRSTLPGDLGIWVSEDDRRRWIDVLRAAGEVVGFQTEMRRGGGVIAPVLVSGKVFEIDGEQYVVTDVHDISAQVERAAYLEGIASHDPLTGLPNRLLIGDRLAQAIARSQREASRVAICYLDLDGFKEVNDTLGHQAGDDVLVEVGRRLRACLRGGDTVARLGGDEFVVLLADMADDDECRGALARLLDSVGEPYTLGGDVRAGISASIGVTVYPTDRSDPDTLIRHADHAMYAAKQAGKSRYHMFDTRYEQRLAAREATLRRLAEALRTGEFRLYYLPKVDCRRGRVVGLEALLRWQHPRLGLLSPAEFVPLIEDSELASETGEWVIRRALAEAVRWQADAAGLPVSVNVFSRHLLAPGFWQRLDGLVRECVGYRPGILQLELVESAALREVKAIRAVIEQCRGLGVTFSLDDFGTGYSTLAHLRHLPVDEIKIDRSFVVQMLDKSEDRAIVEAVIGLGQAFGQTVVAEGVETAAHVAALLAVGCDVMQGYAVGRAMAAAEVPAWLGNFKPDPDWKPAAGPAGAGTA